eukprot:2877580-Lingulodinium_polyedra.AAC.1
MGAQPPAMAVERSTTTSQAPPEHNHGPGTGRRGTTANAAPGQWSVEDHLAPSLSVRRPMHG